VGLISIAVAIPVTLFMASCFEIANDSEAPERWLCFSSLWQKVVFGRNAHRKWHYTRAKQPVRFVRWYARSYGAPLPETVLNLWFSFRAWVTCTLPPWTTEAREAAEEEAEQALGEEVDDVLDAAVDDVLAEAGETAEEKAAAQAAVAALQEAAETDSDGASTSESLAEARDLRHFKRVVTFTGVAGAYLCWALFTWFIFVRAWSGLRVHALRSRRADALCALQTYGSLIYRLLGEGAEVSFANSWGVSYGLSSAAEWQQIVTEALKGALILAILERMCLTGASEWLEEALDYYSLQALFIHDHSVSLRKRIHIYYEHTKRLSDGE
jgi:hypothetical protein